MTDSPTDQIAYDRWAAAYQRWWAPVIAPAAVALLDRLPALLAADRELRLVDIGAGTGTLSLAALDRWPRSRVVGVDPAARMLDLAVEAARIRQIETRFEPRIGEAERLPLPAASVDAAITSFVIQLLPSRIAAVREAHRVLRPGGVFACITWQTDDAPFAPELAFEDAADELDIELPAFPGREPRPYPSAASAGAELRRAGFASVKARETWLEHRYTPQSYLDTLEHWIEDDTFTSLDEPMRRRLRAAVLRRLERMDHELLVWRRPLVSVVGVRSG